jgi:hypothetical protein
MGTDGADGLEWARTVLMGADGALDHAAEMGARIYHKKSNTFCNQRVMILETGTCNTKTSTKKEAAILLSFLQLREKSLKKPKQATSNW